MSIYDTTGRHSFPATVQTTNDTVTTLASYTIPDEATIKITATVIGRQSSSTNSNGYVLTAFAHRESAGTAALIGTADQTVVKEDAAGWDAVIDVSSNDVRVRVTGAAATTINWLADVEVVVYAV